MEFSQGMRVICTTWLQFWEPVKMNRHNSSPSQNSTTIWSVSILRIQSPFFLETVSPKAADVGSTNTELFPPAATMLCCPVDVMRLTAFGWVAIQAFPYLSRAKLSKSLPCNCTLHIISTTPTWPSLVIGMRPYIFKTNWQSNHSSTNVEVIDT